MCLQLVLQMQHTDFSNLNQSGVDKDSSTVAVSLLPGSHFTGVELPVLCIHFVFPSGLFCFPGYFLSWRVLVFLLVFSYSS